MPSKNTLRTLKDLIERADKGNGLVTTIGIKKMLKQEAVKWVKEIQANTTQDFSNLYLIKWIKKFFNLTEEDLEEKE
jgi:hypothetical protein